MGRNSVCYLINSRNSPVRKSHRFHLTNEETEPPVCQVAAHKSHTVCAAGTSFDPGSASSPLFCPTQLSPVKNERDTVTKQKGEGNPPDGLSQSRNFPQVLA